MCEMAQKRYYQKCLPVGKIVDDDLDEGVGALGLSRSEVGSKVGNLGSSVEPRESGNLSNLQRLGLLGSVGDRGGGSIDLSRVVRAQVCGVTRERIDVLASAGASRCRCGGSGSLKT